MKPLKAFVIAASLAVGTPVLAQEVQGGEGATHTCSKPDSMKENVFKESCDALSKALNKENYPGTRYHNFILFENLVKIKDLPSFGINEPSLNELRDEVFQVHAKSMFNFATSPDKGIPIEQKAASTQALFTFLRGRNLSCSKVGLNLERVKSLGANFGIKYEEAMPAQPNLSNLNI